MCLITKQKKALIAKEDIHVFKILRKNRFSSFNGDFEYKKDVLYKTGLGKQIVPANDFNVAFTYFDWRAYDFYNQRTETHTVISEGFHTIVKRNRYDVRYNDNKLYKATIPKGSKYFLDETGLCVSNQLIVH